MSLVLSLIFILTCVVLLAYYVKNVRKIFAFLDRFPGPRAIPYVGNIYELRSTKVAFPVLEKYYSKYGSIFQLWAGFIFPVQFVLVVSDVNFAEFALGSQKLINKSFSYKFMYNWLGTGLLTAGGKKWKQRRRIITPTFHFQILGQFVDVFNTQGQILIKKLEKKVGKDSIDIYPYITLCTLDIICESAMGISIDAQGNSESNYVCAVKEMLRIISDRTFSVLKLYDFMYMFSRDYYKEKKAVKILHDYTNSVIIKRKKNMENKIKGNADDLMGAKKRVAFLDMLLQYSQDGEYLQHEDIREEVDTFMFEGHDTMSPALSFALYLLANNPEAQQKAIEEISEIFQDDEERPASYNDLQEMKYLELVIKETLRLYPSVPVYARVVTEEVEYGDMVLPKGLSIIIDAYHIHRDPSIYPDPEKFIPERFTTENCIGRSPYAYIPFSAGPRNCIGQKFAMLELKATISQILRKFKLSPSIPHHTVIPVPDVIINSSNGIRIRLEERE